MKFAVIGIGAVGSIIGGLLTKSGEYIILIGKKYQVDVIKQNGITIRGLDEKIQDIKTDVDLSVLKDVDAVFICVKSQDTESLVSQLKKYVRKNTLIISLQNGVRNAETVSKITGNPTLAGVVLFNAIYSNPGEVELTIEGGILLENDKKFSKKISDLLNKAGIKTIIVENIKGYQWSKLILNLQIAVTALTGQTIKESITNKNSRKIIVATMKEGLDILNRCNVTRQKLPRTDPQDLIKKLDRYNSLILKLGSGLMGVKDNAKNSMWQSLARGKPTEIDFINGEITRLAEKKGFKAPINSKLVKLIKQAENSKINNIKTDELIKILNI